MDPMTLQSEKKRFGKACLSVLVSLCLALSICLGPAAAAYPAFASNSDSAFEFASQSAQNLAQSPEPEAASEAEPLTVEEVEQSIGPADSYVHDEILVRYENGDVDTVDVDRGESVAEAIVEAEADPEIEDAQPNYVYTLMDDGASGSSANLTAWHLKMIRAQQAWGLLTKGKQVTVATIDSGCDLNHADLQKALWRDKAWDVVTNDYLKKSRTFDAVGHGTHVAGIIAGAANGTYGTAGVFPNAKVLPVNVIDGNTRETTTKSLVVAYRKILQYKNELNVRVINMSIGGPYRDEMLHNEIVEAWYGGVVTVGAAGNEGDASDTYPADFGECLSVTSCDKYGTPLPSSCFGEKKDLCAPGGEILSTIPGSGYGYKSGTSMACPVVSAVAAMVASIHPEYGVREIKADILETVSEKDFFASNECYGGLFGVGIVDAYAAVSRNPIKVVKPKLLTPKFEKSAITKKHGDSSFRNPITASKVASYSSSNTNVLTVSSSGTVTIVGPGVAYVRAKVTGWRYVPGTYSYKVTVKPKATKLTKKTKSSAKGKLTVAWKKGSGSITGYQIKYRKAGSSKWKTKTIKGKSKVKKTIKKLKRGKKYYVKVRTYKTVSGTKLYSSWSKAKKVKIRK